MEPSLYEDHPISEPEDDEFERASYVDELFELVGAVEARNGAVVGLLGSWGSGKSSILNLLRPKLATVSAARDVISLNPWLFSDAQDLVQQLLTEFARQTKLDNSRSHRQVLDAMSALAFALEPVSWAAGAPGLGSGFRGFLRALKTKFTAGKSIDELRTDLSAIFTDLRKPVFVFVDDLDRMSSNEIREALRFIRLVGQLPNVVYIVALDDRAVGDLLDSSTVGRGSNYLEKILPITSRVPRPEWSEVRSFLESRLELVSRDTSPGWELSYAGPLSDLIETPRDAKRVAIAVRQVSSGLGVSIRLEDLVLIEAVRLKDPALFKYIEDGPVTGAVSTGALFAWGLSGEQEQAQLTKWLGAAPKSAVDLGNVLELLFPFASDAIKGRRTPHTASRRWTAEGRLGTPANWRLYKRHLRAEEHEILDIAKEVTPEILSSPDQFVRFLVDRAGDRTLEVVLAVAQNEASKDAAATLDSVLLFAGSWHLMPFGSSPKSVASRVELFRGAVQDLVSRLDYEPDLDWGGWLSTMLNSDLTLSAKYLLVELFGRARQRDKSEEELNERSNLVLAEVQRQVLAASPTQLEDEWNLAYMFIQMIRNDVAVGQLHRRAPRVLKQLYATLPNYHPDPLPRQDDPFAKELFGEKTASAFERAGL